MRTKLLTIFLLLSYTSILAQTEFAKGYFIDNLNQKTECFIKNADWKNNPNEFEYRISEEGPSARMSTQLVKEFGIYDISKFVRVNIQIDKSSDGPEMSNQRAPIWAQEEAMLKIVIEGSATLYSYERTNLIRYFFKVNDSPVQQLIYKKYLLEDNVAINSDFRQQLWTRVRCGNSTESSIKNVDYSLHHLAKYFINYNQCTGTSFVDYYKRKTAAQLYYRITPGINMSSYTFFSPTQTPSDRPENKTQFRFGFEMTYVLPFRNNKWGIVLEPSFVYFKANTIPYPTLPSTSTSYKGIELPLGLRHYFFLAERFQLFLGGYYITNFNLSKSSRVPVQPHPKLAAGLGIMYGKLGAEFRYYGPNPPYDYQQNAIIFGYRLK